MRTPRSSTGHTSSRPSWNMRNISAVQRPIPRTRVSCSHDLGVGAAADAIEHDRPREHVLGKVSDRRRLRRREPGAPQRIDGRREHLLGRGIAVEEGFEAPVDRASGRSRQLLVADRAGQLGEVRPARAARPQVARPGRLHDLRERREAPGKVGARLHELTSGHEANRIRGCRPLTYVSRETPHRSLTRARRHARALRRRLRRRRSGGGQAAETPSTKAATDNSLPTGGCLRRAGDRAAARGLRLARRRRARARTREPVGRQPRLPRSDGARRCSW